MEMRNAFIAGGAAAGVIAALLLHFSAGPPGGYWVGDYYCFYYRGHPPALSFADVARLTPHVYIPEGYPPPPHLYYIYNNSLVPLYTGGPLPVEYDVGVVYETANQSVVYIADLGVYAPRADLYIYVRDGRERVIAASGAGGPNALYNATAYHLALGWVELYVDGRLCMPPEALPLFGFRIDVYKP
ncbi:MAG: hypothetical protein ACP5H5_03785 [Pyrobaculum sp.]